MIIVIDALNKDRLAGVLDEMFRLRARVFGDRLGWEVKIEDGREIDEFDALDPAYVVGLDEDGHVISCVRYLQTTGPHMLSDVFQNILGGEPPLRSPRIWESTRFCVDTDRLRRTGSSTTVSQATCELLIHAIEYARRSGITDIVTVIDPIIDRVVKRSDCAPYGYLGSTVQMGKSKAMAALVDCTPERIARLRAYSGISGDAFLTDDEAIALAARREELPEGNCSYEDLISYCEDQVAHAVTAHDRQSADRLCRMLLDGADAARITATAQASQMIH